MHSLRYAYRDRRARKGEFRRLWIVRINAACREHEMSYSQFHRGSQGGAGRGRPQDPCRPRGARTRRVRRARDDCPPGARRCLTFLLLVEFPSGGNTLMSVGSARCCAIATRGRPTASSCVRARVSLLGRARSGRSPHRGLRRRRRLWRRPARSPPGPSGPISRCECSSRVLRRRSARPTTPQGVFAIAWRPPSRDRRAHRRRPLRGRAAPHRSRERRNTHPERGRGRCVDNRPRAAIGSTRTIPRSYEPRPGHVSRSRSWRVYPRWR